MSETPSTPSTRRPRRAGRDSIPGFGLTMGFTLICLSALVILPLGLMSLQASKLTWRQFVDVLCDPLTVSAFKITFLCSAAAAAISAVLGLLVAWVLVRYRFFGRAVLDALVDFPFILPTAVAGLTFATLYGKEGWIGLLGDHLRDALNWLLALAHLPWRFPATSFGFLNLPLATWHWGVDGIIMVLVFVGLPFVVRTLQPVLQDLSIETEEAAASLGASRWATFRRVIFPMMLPAWLGGIALAMARAIGEYGSVIYISGNIPGKSQIAPQAIVAQLESYNYPAATAISMVLLVASLLMLLIVNGISRWAQRSER